MSAVITGIHHVTALASNSQHNVDFYSGILGIRLIKKTINFDAPEIYHLYYGDSEGNPGSILTFFPYPGIVKGRKGKGMVNITSFSVPMASLSFWEQRLEKFGINYGRPKERFGNAVTIYFEDGDGMGLELAFNEKDKRPGFSYGNIPVEYAIKGFYRVEIYLNEIFHTATLLKDMLDHHFILEEDNISRFAATDSPGNYVDLVASPNSARALGGGGTVHHIAFSTPDEASQLKARDRLINGGFTPTQVVDRQYFNSIYFREPGGVLFEVATEGPGFMVDESQDRLGEALKLPSWYEPRRSIIEQAVGPISLNIENFK